MNRIFSLSFLVGSMIVLGHVDNAAAQYSAGRNVRTATQSFLYNRPTVSPYLSLTTRDANSGLPQYFTNVRPRLQQRQQDQARQRQSAQMQRQLNQVSAQQAQMQRDQQGMVLTGRIGWSSQGYPRHGIFLNHYPGMRQIRSR